MLTKKQNSTNLIILNALEEFHTLHNNVKIFFFFQQTVKLQNRLD